MEGSGSSRIASLLWSAAVFLAVLLLALLADPARWWGAGHLGYLLGLGGFSLGFALLTALGQRASRLTLILAAVGICGYLSVGLPALGLVVPLLLFPAAATAAGLRFFTLTVMLGLIILSLGVRLVRGEQTQVVLGYELLAILTLSLLGVALGEMIATRRRLADRADKLQESRHELKGLATLRARAEAGQRHLGERLRVSRRLHDQLAHHLALVSLHTNAALEEVSGDEAATVNLEHVRDSSAKALQELRRTVDSMDQDGLGDRDAGTLGDIEELASTLRDAGLRVEVSAPGVDLDDRLPILLLRLVREAAINAVRHADTTHLVVFLRLEESEGQEHWLVSVRNDGVRRGAKDAVDGLGLAMLRQKISEADGSVEWGRLGRHFLLSAEIRATQTDKS
ncbi:sensor histidine kinase [Glutamicibacter creatinolyticus]|uniref:sensor histidine kinase n=1 Tax=Glutamicibacter creatinolyticus TaxID=162496 RepID=UPI003B97E94A